MALVTNQLGPFTFLVLDGDPDAIKEQVEIVSRPGVPGLGLWRLGKRGAPFELRSAVDAQSFAHARSLATQYAQLVGTLQSLEWNSLDLTAENFRVAVLDVRPVRVARIATSVGGLNPPSLGWVEAAWLLVGVEVSAE